MCVEKPNIRLGTRKDRRRNICFDTDGIKALAVGAATAVISLAVGAFETLFLLTSEPVPSARDSHFLRGVTVILLAGATICGVVFAGGKFVSGKGDSDLDAFHDLLEMVDLAGFMLRDCSGIIRFWSNGCQSMFGWTAAEAVGQSSHDLLHTVFPVPLADVEATLLRNASVLVPKSAMVVDPQYGERRNPHTSIRQIVRQVVRPI